MAFLFLPTRHHVLHFAQDGSSRLSISFAARIVLLLLLLLLLTCTPLSASGATHQEQVSVEEFGTETTADNRLWEADAGLASRVLSVPGQQSAFRSSGKTTSADALDEAEAAGQVSPSSLFDPDFFRVQEEELKRKQRRHKLCTIAGAATAGLLLLLAALAVPSLLQPATPVAAEAEARLLGEPPGSKFTALAVTAAAATEQVQYLEQLVVDAERAAQLCKEDTVTEALERIKIAVNTAKSQASQIHEELKRAKEEQQEQQKGKEQQDAQEQQTQKDPAWQLNSLLLDHAYSTAARATYHLMKALVPPLSASARIASARASRLSIIQEKARRLVDEAETVLEPSELTFLKAYLFPLVLEAKKAESELRLLRTEALEFESRLQQQAETRDPPLPLLQEALGVLQQATERRVSVQSMMHAASCYVRDGELAVLALSRSAASHIAVMVAALRKDRELMRYVLQSKPVPQAHATQAAKYLRAGPTLDELSLQVQQLHQDMQFMSDPREAVGTLQLLRFAHDRAFAEMAEASSIAIIAGEDDEQFLGEATLTLVSEGETGEDVSQQVPDEEWQREQTSEMRALLVAAVENAIREVSGNEHLSFDDETVGQLSEGQGGRFAQALLPSRQVFKEWKHATNEMEKAEKAATQAAQRLVDEEQISSMGKTADEAVHGARLVATHGATATRLWLRCSAWLKVEKALSFALDRYEETLGALQRVNQQQQGEEEDQEPQQQQLPAVLRDVATLQAEAEAHLQSEDINAAALLASEVEELVRHGSLLLNQREASQGGKTKGETTSAMTLLQ
ncbi:hypothetical protein ACSSS7_002222 [Eimeria intestinalis]